MESGWNVWVWLVGVVSSRRVWLVGEGGIYGCGCKEVYRFPNTTISSILQKHSYFFSIKKMFFVLYNYIYTDSEIIVLTRWG